MESRILYIAMIIDEANKTHSPRFVKKSRPPAAKIGKYLRPCGGAGGPVKFRNNAAVFPKEGVVGGILRTLGVTNWGELEFC